MSAYQPPYRLTTKMVTLVSEISEQIGLITILQGKVTSPHWRRENRIRTIHSSLAIEHNSLSLDQMTAIISGKRVLGKPNEIKEVKNAYRAYELLPHLNPFSEKDLLTAHHYMMEDLVTGNGQFRSGDVGVFNRERLVHLAPPAQFIPNHIPGLLDWYESSPDHPLIKSAVFHYEFEFIHPFADGNGRMGRLWHSLLLGQWRDLFFWLPIEEMIRLRQQEYYDALATADAQADSTPFVELMLAIINDTLKKESHLGRSGQTTDQDTDQDTIQETIQGQSSVDLLLATLGNETLSASELMKRLGLSHRYTFRRNYLHPALEQQLIERTLPDKPNSKYQKYRKHRSA